MNRSQFKHLHPLEVRWGDADIFGHINNVQYIRYYESGRVTYCEEALGFEFKTGLDAGWILADIQCSYLKQLHYPASIEVATAISKVGTSSVELQAAIFIKGTEELVSTSKAVLVWVDLRAGRSAPIPSSQRECIELFEEVKKESTLIQE